MNSAFIFDFDGIPIWDVRPLPSVPQWPPGWDADKWVAHMTDEYNSSRKKLFDRLYKSAVRKKKHRDQEEKDRIEKLVQEAREKAEHERKEKEERDKEAARIRREKREKLEKEGQEYVEQLISLDFEFTDDESDDEEPATKSNGKAEGRKIQKVSLMMLQMERVTLNMRKMETVYRIKQNQQMKMKWI